MCREAMQTVLSKASSEPWFLKEMFRNPAKVFSKYNLTLEEKKVLLSGCISDIEICAAKNITPSLRKNFEDALCFSRDYTGYFAQHEERVEEDISEFLEELAIVKTR